jgi:hypothetical protein
MHKRFNKNKKAVKKISDFADNELKKIKLIVKINVINSA